LLEGRRRRDLTRGRFLSLALLEEKQERRGKSLGGGEGSLGGKSSFYSRWGKSGEAALAYPLRSPGKKGEGGGDCAR